MTPDINFQNYRGICQTELARKNPSKKINKYSTALITAYPKSRSKYDRQINVFKTYV